MQNPAKGRLIWSTLIDIVIIIAVIFALIGILYITYELLSVTSGDLTEGLGDNVYELGEITRAFASGLMVVIIAVLIAGAVVSITVIFSGISFVRTNLRLAKMDAYQAKTKLRKLKINASSQIGLGTVLVVLAAVISYGLRENKGYILGIPLVVTSLVFFLSGGLKKSAAKAIDRISPSPRPAENPYRYY